VRLINSPMNVRVPLPLSLVSSNRPLEITDSGFSTVAYSSEVKNHLGGQNMGTNSDCIRSLPATRFVAGRVGSSGVGLNEFQSAAGQTNAPVLRAIGMVINY